jgi:hypothetical protein
LRLSLSIFLILPRTDQVVPCSTLLADHEQKILFLKATESVSSHETAKHWQCRHLGCETLRLSGPKKRPMPGATKEMMQRTASGRRPEIDFGQASRQGWDSARR